MRLTKTKSYSWWYLLPILLLTSCLEPEPVELPFFTVKTNPIIPNSDNLLGTVVLKGEISGLDQSESIDEYGFLFSEDLSFVNDFSNVDQNLFLSATIDNSCSIFCFKTEEVTIKSETNYFVRAFARKGERIVFGAIELYRQKLDFEVNFTERKNDILFFESKIKGLTNDIDITEFGVLIATDTADLYFNNTSVIQKNYGALSSDSSFVDRLDALHFNTSYYFKPYAKGAKTFFGDIETYHVTDGWIEVGGLPFDFGISNAVVVTDETDAYLVGGCKRHIDGACDGYINENTYKLSFDDNEWALFQEPHYNAKLTQAVGFFYNQKILIGQGLISGSFSDKIVDILTNQNFGACEGYEYENIYNTVSFTTDNAIYLGTGRKSTLSDNFEQNTFWQLILNEDCMEVQAMPPLPTRINGNDIVENAGREGAISWQANNRYFVGFGNKGAILFNDVYEFKLPQTGAPSWEFVSTNESPVKRKEAISFSIGDRAFIGLGYALSLGINAYLNDLWEFCPESPDGIWKKCEPLPTQGRRSAFGFALNGHGYIGGGLYQEFGPSSPNNLLKDTWMYIPEDKE